MSLGEQPAFPRVVPLNIDREYEAGMTYRQWLAGMAMQGILASSTYWPSKDDAPQVSYLSNLMADALIAKLEEKS